MYAPFSRRDIGTLVSPILGTAVAIPAASRCSERIASRVEEERIGIVEKTDEQLCATTSKFEEKRELGNSRSDIYQFMLVIHGSLTANHSYSFVRLRNYLPLLIVFAVIFYPKAALPPAGQELAPGMFPGPTLINPGPSDEAQVSDTYISFHRTTAFNIADTPTINLVDDGGPSHDMPPLGQPSLRAVGANYEVV